MLTSTHGPHQWLHDGGTAAVGAEDGFDTDAPEVHLVGVDCDVVGGGPELGGTDVVGAGCSRKEGREKS